MKSETKPFTSITKRTTGMETIYPYISKAVSEFLKLPIQFISSGPRD